MKTKTITRTWTRWLLVCACLLLVVGMFGTASADKLVVYADTASDGRIDNQSSAVSWATIRAAPGNRMFSTNNTAITILGVADGSSSNTYIALYRFLWSGNTSALAGSTINSAVMSYYGATGGSSTGGQLNVTIASASPIDPTAISVSDFNRTDYTSYSDDTPITWATWDGGAGRRNFTLNAAGLAAINTTGYTSVYLMFWRDRVNAGFWGGDGLAATLKGYDTSAGDPYKPFLEIDYTPGEEEDITPPASVSNIVNNTPTCNGLSCRVNISWTNPGDADYHHAYHLQNNTVQSNVTAPTNYVNWTGLAANTAYTISIKTVDETGNMNGTWTNLTITTPALAHITWPKLVIMSDDGFGSSYDYMYQYLHQYNLNATIYIITNRVGTGTNLTLANMTTMYDNNWDMGSHGADHVYMTGLSAAEQILNMNESIADLDGWGFTRASRHFAYPYGDRDATTNNSAFIAGFYTTRDSHQGNTTVPFTAFYAIPFTLCTVVSTSVATVENTITGATLTNQTVILGFHKFDTSGDEYSWTPTKMSQLATWIAEQGYETITISEWYELNGGTGEPGVPAPVANFTANVTSGTAPLAVAFTDSSTDVSTAWNWSLNNVTGNNTVIWWSTDQNPEISLGVGNWSFALNASSTIGHNTTPGDYWINVSAAAAPAPLASLTTNVTSGAVPLAVAFTDTSTNTPTLWNWSFGDGNWSNGTSATAEHLYEYVGVFNASLIASNEAGSNQSANTTITVSDETTPVASFTKNRVFVVVPQLLRVNDTSTNTPTGWNWSWGDGQWTNTTDSASRNATHSYTRPGYFPVSLMATNGAGTNLTARQWVFVWYWR